MVVSLEMGWRHLLFENWPVDSEVVAAHLPDQLTVDTYDGSAWLSVVPFTNVNLRPAGFPEPIGLPLPELNLRTYVSCDGEPGVYFFNLDAQGLLSVIGARLFQHLPYYYARTSLDWADGRVQFKSRRLHPGERPVHYEASYWPTGEPFASTADPLAQFLVERYRFYTQAQDGSVRYADVDHEPWTLYPAESEVDTNELFTANGFAEPDGQPVSYYSPGVDVAASPSKRWTEQ
jgi:uncharacterized protein YqjF (DUF2071 family)